MTPAVHPVDVIWAVENATSLQTAIVQIDAGLNDFATLLGGYGLDYRVIMLSLRSKTSPVTIGGSSRYAVCIPPPLAGDANCGNGQRFFQSRINMMSTQILEQFLGTLGQTSGYQPADSRGGEAWSQWLRTDATKSIVVVTADNARLSPDQFENFPGGPDPFNTTTLPAGILHSSRGGLFDGYLFDGMYGWGSDTDPAVLCQYPGGGMPASAGPVYTTLVSRTGGVRAQVCDAASTWGTFSTAIAGAAARAARIDCTIPLPPPTAATGVLTAVELVGSQTTMLTEVAGAGACGAGGGFYRPDAANVTLCPTSCDLARTLVGPNRTGSIRARYGCPP